MREEEIQRLIEQGVPGSRVEVSGDGRHFSATVVSAEFAGARMLERHRRVYAALGRRFDDDQLHALSLKTYTPVEWEKLRG